MKSLLTPNDWHERFTQQARWTRDLRNYLYEQAGFWKARRVLEVGCGTGALLADIEANRKATALPQDYPILYGLDLNKEYLKLTARHARRARLIEGDAYRLPYAAGSFDLAYCHFLLLWIRDPESVIAEMARVTRPNGAVLALAEPDYGGRIDYPPELAQLGQWQQEALQRQGAATHTGRQLAAIFNHAGLKEVECGVLGGQWRSAPAGSEAETEWKVLLDDLSGQVSEAQLRPLRELDLQARQRGERILYVPTFYAYGRR